MANAMAFYLLGSLTVRVRGVVVPIPTGKQRAILAVLLLNAGRTVSADQLAELLWGPELPPSAAVTLRSHVKRLRQALGAGRDRIVTQPGGYLIEVDPGELDIASMEDALAVAHQAARADLWPDAAAHACAALAFWRGEPLSDVELGVLASQEIPRLTELRFQARELRIEAGLQLGRHAELVAEARQLTFEAPLREHLHVLLMRALHECGRRAEALEAYQVARRALAEELGCEPGAELAALHREILNDKAPIPTRPPARQEPTAAGRRELPVPRELPAAVASFTGRGTELAALDALLDTPPAGAPPAMLITAIGGTAGVGKTALAVQWAHRIIGRFPDGQLYVNLRGYDPGQPLPAGDALAGFLRALGIPGQDIPPEDRERATRYRSLLAGRRMLVLLDNARDADQVRPLLPGTPGCAALVTSRDALAGLVARDGARRLDLDLLPLSDAVGLLRTLIGGRVEAEPEAAVALAELCCRLPLALRVAAELAAARPGIRLAEVAAELADEQRRLDLLDAGGDVRTAVRAVFSWSCQHLDPGSAQVFHLIGDHPGASYDSRAVAALANISAAQAGQRLDLLYRAYLVQPAGPGRYNQHDLLRAYGRELAASHNSPAERQAARARLIDYYLHAAGAAMDALLPAERDLRPRLTPQSAPLPVPAQDPLAARAWLDTERANLVAVARLAVHHWPEQACQLSAILHRYLDKGSHFDEAALIHDSARRAASRAGDRTAEATALVNLAGVDGRQGRYAQGAAQLRQALSQFADAGNLAGQARALNNLGAIEFFQGHHRDAERHVRDALALLQQTDDSVNTARTLANLGVLKVQHGHYKQAKGYLYRALAICEETGNLTDKANALGALGDAELRLGQHLKAVTCLQQALELWSQAGDRAEQARVLCDLGVNELRQDRPARAIAHLEQALGLASEVGDQFAMFSAHSGLGEVMLSTGRPAAALSAYQQALELACHVAAEARAHEGLGNAHDACGDPGPARSHWQKALALYSDLGVPEADQIRIHLARSPDV